MPLKNAIGTGDSASPASQERAPGVAPSGVSRRDLAIALSLANLCYLRVWTELLTYRRGDTYLMKAAPGPAQLAAVMTNVLLLGLLLWGAVTLARKRLSKSAFRWVQCVFLLFLAVPVNALRAVASREFEYLKSPLFELLGSRGVAALGIVLAVAGVGSILLFHRKLAPLAAAILFAFFPFCALTFGQGLWKIANYRADAFAPNALSPPLRNAKTSPRVVWILFDEWDYDLTFIEPASDLRFPELKRLGQESVVASQALPPGPETPISIPGYFTGRLVQRVQYDGPRELQITYQGSSAPVPWSQQPSVFTSARQLGFNTALVDWFHPSCRILSGLTSCEWWEMPVQFNSMGHTFWQQLPGQTRSLFETTLFSAFGQSLSVLQQVETYREILRRGLAIANDPSYGFSFIHMPIPHAPHAYDRRTGKFTLKNSPIRGYFDSLALLDLTLGEIRRSMEVAGTWDRTTVLITSDHPYREAEALVGKKDPRIPYFLKMAAQKDTQPYSQPFNTVLTHDLLLAILRGEATNAQEVAEWLDRNRGRVPVNRN
jgi:hypothetical protein